MALLNVDGVLGPQQLVGGDQPHVLLHHQVLDDAHGRQREAVPTVDQHPLPLLRGRVHALVDVFKAALSQGPHGVWDVSYVHLQTGPAVAGPAGAGTGDEAEPSFSPHAAHVNDTVDVVAAECAPIVRGIQVPHVDIIRHLADDRL